MKPDQVTSTAILFNETEGSHAERLFEKLESVSASLRVLKCNSIGALESMIDSFDKQRTVLLLMLNPGDGDNSFFKLKQKGGLNHVRIILILPEISEDSVREYLKLTPSYIADLESDFDDVVAVMAKMGAGKTGSDVSD